MAETPPDLTAIQAELDRLAPGFYNALAFDAATNPGGFDGDGHRPPQGVGGKGNLFALAADVQAVGSWLGQWVVEVHAAAATATAARDTALGARDTAVEARDAAVAARDTAVAAAGAVTLSSAPPAPLGVAAAGTATESARADHVHPYPKAKSIALGLAHSLA